MTIKLIEEVELNRDDKIRERVYNDGIDKLWDQLYFTLSRHKGGIRKAITDCSLLIESAYKDISTGVFNEHNPNNYESFVDSLVDGDDFTQMVSKME